jgi:hypothetical protein
VLVPALFLLVTGVALVNDDIARLRWVLGSRASDSAAGDVTLRATLGQPVGGVVSSRKIMAESRSSLKRADVFPDDEGGQVGFAPLYIQGRMW